MAPSLEHVSDADLPKAHRFALEKLEAARAERSVTLAELANRLDLSESALKQFMFRGRQPDFAPSRGSAVFSQIYRHFAEAEAHIAEAEAAKPRPKLTEFLPEIGQILTGKAHLSANPFCRGAIYAGIMSMLQVDSREMESTNSRVLKREFYCFRNAAMRGYYVKSLVRFERIVFDELSTFEFHHCYIDDNGLEKKSDGLAISLNKTVYLLGDVQEGEGLDLIMIREPMDDTAEVLSAFQVTIDDHRPICSNAVLIDADIFDNFHRKEINKRNMRDTGVFSKDQILGLKLFGSKINSENLLTQLHIPDGAGSLRIKLRKLISSKLADTL